MSVISITQARISSSRFESKVLKKVLGKSLIDVHFSRLRKSKLIDHMALAIADEPSAVRIVDSIGNKEKMSFHFGSVQNVLDRFYKCAQLFDAEYVVRLTSDCPLIDPQIVDDVIRYTMEGGYDYVSNAIVPTFPDGLDVEVFKKDLLIKTWERATKEKHLEHVTPYIWENYFLEKPYENWKIGVFKSDVDLSNFRLTLDYEEDYILFNHLISELGEDCSHKDYVDYLKAHAEIRAINEKYVRNEGY